jgi:hypothetical protein
MDVLKPKFQPFDTVISNVQNSCVSGHFWSLNEVFRGFIMLNNSDFFLHTFFPESRPFHADSIRLLPSLLSNFPSERSVILWAK